MPRFKTGSADAYAEIQSGHWKLNRTAYEILCKVIATFDRQLAVTPFYEFMPADESLNALIARRKKTPQTGIKIPDRIVVDPEQFPADRRSSIAANNS